MVSTHWPYRRQPTLSELQMFFAALHERAGGCRTAGRPQLPEEESSGKRLCTISKQGKTNTRVKNAVCVNTQKHFCRGILKIFIFKNVVLVD